MKQVRRADLPLHQTSARTKPGLATIQDTPLGRLRSAIDTSPVMRQMAERGTLVPRGPPSAMPVQRVTIGKKDLSAEAVAAHLHIDPTTENLNLIKQINDHYRRQRFETLKEYLATSRLDRFHDPDFMHGGFKAVSNFRITRRDSFGDVSYDGSNEARSLRQVNLVNKPPGKRAAAKNRVSLSITVNYRLDDDTSGGVRPVGKATVLLKKQWASGNQQYDTPETINIKGERDGQRDSNWVGQYSRRKSVNANDRINAYVEDRKLEVNTSLHHHSEIALISDPEHATLISGALKQLFEKLPHERKFKILSFHFNVDSYPNAMCTTLCRSAMTQAYETFALEAESYADKLGKDKVSSTFGTIMIVASEKQFDTGSTVKADADSKLLAYSETANINDRPTKTEGRRTRLEVVPQPLEAPSSVTFDAITGQSDASNDDDEKTSGSNTSRETKSLARSKSPRAVPRNRGKEEEGETDEARVASEMKASTLTQSDRRKPASKRRTVSLQKTRPPNRTGGPIDLGATRRDVDEDASMETSSDARPSARIGPSPRKTKVARVDSEKIRSKIRARPAVDFTGKRTERSESDQPDRTESGVEPPKKKRKQQETAEVTPMPPTVTTPPPKRQRGIQTGPKVPGKNRFGGKKINKKDQWKKKS